MTTSAEMTYYVDSIKTLLQSESDNAYKEKLTELKTIWSNSFTAYFKQSVDKVIDKYGSWKLRPFGLQSCTTNQSESFNNVLKRLHDWKEAPIDAMVLSLYRLCEFYVAEIRRGKCGVGNYSLREGVLPDEPCTSRATDVEDSGDIVKRIRLSLAAVTGTADNRTDYSDASSSSTALNAVQNTASNDNSEVRVSLQPVLTTASTATFSHASVFERASYVISTGQIALDPKLSTLW